MNIHIPSVPERKTPNISNADRGQVMAEQIISMLNGVVVAAKLGVPTTGLCAQIFAYLDHSAVSGDEEVVRKTVHAAERAVEILIREGVRPDVIPPLFTSIKRMEEQLGPISSNVEMTKLHPDVAQQVQG